MVSCQAPPAKSRTTDSAASQGSESGALEPEPELEAAMGAAERQVPSASLQRMCGVFGVELVGAEAPLRPGSAKLDGCGAGREGGCIEAGFAKIETTVRSCMSSLCVLCVSPSIPKYWAAFRGCILVCKPYSCVLA